MKPAVIFKLGVRGVGVLLLYQAVHMMLLWAGGVFGSGTMLFPAFVQGILLAGTAAWFLKGAPPIERWAYPTQSPLGQESVLTKETLSEEEGEQTPCVACGKMLPPETTSCPACGWTQPGEHS